MDGNPAIYLGRIVPKENFRAFVYDCDGASRLAESWAEFQDCIKTGKWFATLEDAKKSLAAIEEKNSEVITKTRK